MGKIFFFKIQVMAKTVRKRSYKLWQAVCLKEKRAFRCVKTRVGDYYSFQNEKYISTREVGFHLSLKLKK